MHEIVLALFVRGHRIEVEKLKSAYRRELYRIGRFLNAAGLRDDPLDGAEKVVRDTSSRSKVASSLRRRARKEYGRERASGVAESAMINVLLGLSGAPIAPGGLSELSRVAGWAPFFEERLGDVGPLVDESPEEELRDAFEVADVEVLRTVLEEASIQELEAARDATATLRAVAKEMVRYTSRVFGSGTAMGFGTLDAIDEESVAILILSTVATLQRLGENGEDIVSSLSEPLSRLRGTNRILDALPGHMSPAVTGVEAETSLTPGEREQILHVIDRLKCDDPDVAAALESPDLDGT